jgi:hypothetical protein
VTFSPETPDGPLEFYLRRIEQLKEGAQSLEWGVNRL